jgi:hypothetical protein
MSDMAKIRTVKATIVETFGQFNSMITITRQYAAVVFGDQSVYD